jgi:hypothetical protein
MTPERYFRLTLGLTALLIVADSPAHAPPPSPPAGGEGGGVIGITAGVTGSCPYGLVA